MYIATYFLSNYISLYYLFKVAVFGVFLVMTSYVIGQAWNEAHIGNGITVKTLYVPVRKGSNSIPIPDFSRVRPLATLNLPNSASGGGGDLQPASTLNQNFRPKVSIQDFNVQPLQDLRPKTNNHLYKAEFHGQVPNFSHFSHGNNIHQQQYANPPQHQLIHATNQNYHGQQHQFYQQEPVSNYVNGQPQNIFVQRNNTPQNLNIGISKGQIVVHDTHASTTNGKVSNFHNPINYGQHVYPNENIVVQRVPNSNSAFTQFHNSPNTVHQAFQRGNVANHEVSSASQNTDASYPGESPRHFHQSSTGTTPTQQIYITTPTEAPSYMHGNHQVNYIQNDQNNQHFEIENPSSNNHQVYHSQENRYAVPETNNQLQQPVNTYAIVHQRVPDNNYATQGNRIPPQSEQNYHRQTYDTRTVPSHVSYTSSNHEQVPFQVASQNQIKIENPQNSVDSQQYQVKQMVPVNVDNQYNGHPVTAHVMMSQYSQNHQDSHEAQFYSQQQVSEPQTQDIKNNQAQNSMTSQPYPDPTSETYYPENKQVYVAPPPDYSSQQLQPTPREQGYVRYTSHVDTNVHNSQLVPITVQSGRSGISLSIPARSYAYQDQSNKYNNYA